MTADPDPVAARYAAALAAIVATLGPEHVCSCELPEDCGIREEAAEALHIANTALGGGDWWNHGPPGLKDRTVIERIEYYQGKR